MMTGAEWEDKASSLTNEIYRLRGCMAAAGRMLRELEDDRDKYRNLWLEAAKLWGIGA